MKITKRLVLLAFSAVLAIAVVSPAVASAQQVWYLNEEPLQNGGGGLSWAEVPYEAVFAQSPKSVLEVRCEFQGSALLINGPKGPGAVVSPPDSFPEETPGSWCSTPNGIQPWCGGQPTSKSAWTILGEGSNWKIEHFNLDTHIHNLAGEEKCFHYNEARVEASESTPFFPGWEGKLNNPVRLAGMVKGTSTSPIDKEYEAGATLEINFLGAEVHP